MYDELVKKLRDNAECLVKASSGCLSNSFADTMCQAADAIEELQGRAKVLEKVADKWCEAVPKWIPVTERLPEPYKSVLLYSGEEVYTGYMHNDRRFTVNASKFPDRPTHWMPLPEQPNEE